MPAPSPPGSPRSEEALGPTPAPILQIQVIEDAVHNGIECASCHTFPIIGTRFHCLSCPGGLDFCGTCEERGLGFLPSAGLDHHESHFLVKIAAPLTREIASFLVSALAQGQSRFLDFAGGRSRANEGMSRPPAASQSEHSDGWIRPNGNAQVGSPVFQSPHPCCSACSRPLAGGARYLCANCPLTQDSSGQVGYVLCQSCETRSLLLHDPTHFFLKISSAMSHAHISPTLLGDKALLPPLYKENDAALRAQRQGTLEPRGRGQQSDAKRFQELNLVPLESLVHAFTLCDSCFEVVEGAWLRCCNCVESYDLCARCQFRGNHDATHVFAVFKQPVDVPLFKTLVGYSEEDVARRGASRPMLESSIFASS